MKKPKLCIDCQHLQGTRCHALIRQVPNLVNGGSKTIGGHWDADFMRYDLSECGRSGKLFKKRTFLLAPTKKDNAAIWDKIAYGLIILALSGALVLIAHRLLDTIKPFMP